MLLQDTDNIPPVLPVEVRAQDIPCVGGPQEVGEGARELIFIPLEAQMLYLGLMYRLDDRRTTPVDFRICHVHAAVVCRHGPCCELNPTVRAWIINCAKSRMVANI